MNKLKFLMLTLLLGHLGFALPTEKLTKVPNSYETQQEEKEKRLVLFWSTWCPDCKDKMTDTFPKIPNRDFEILTVNTEGSQKRAQHYVEKHNIQYPVYLDDDRKLQKELKLFAVPAWAVYEKQDGASWTLKKAANAFDTKAVNEVLGKNYF